MKFLAPRWRKVLRDLWSNRTRTILVLLSIAVGVTALGMVMGSQIIVARNLPAAYTAINPASATLYTLASFSDGLVETVRAMPEIEAAEGRRSVSVRFLTKDGEWRNLDLTAVPDYERMTLNKIKPQTGEYPPPSRTMVIERASLSDVAGLGDVAVGDTIRVEAPSGRVRDIRVVGTVHDMSRMPAYMGGFGYGYINYDTLAWLGEPDEYNQLVFVVAENKLDFDHVTEVGKRVERRIENAGVPVLFTLVLPPGEHPAQNFLDAFTAILTAIGLLALGLSAFLIVNTLSAILQQHVRQIGIMKAIGARAGQITRMYYVMVLAFGVLALAIAAPLGALGAIGLASIFAELLNFDVGGFSLDPQVFLIQALTALAAPLLAATVPILQGVRITVREAVSEYGLGKGHFGHSLLDRTIVALKRVLPIGRPMQISLRNTFRRKSRLTMTMITLSLASTIFIAIFSIRASLQQTLEDALTYFDYDVQIVFDQSYRTDRIQSAIEDVPGVDTVETWGFGTTRIVRANGTESDNVVIYAPRVDTTMLNPIMVRGRWLLPDDANAMVINTDVLTNDPDLDVGSVVTTKIGNRDVEWVIVGIVRGVLTGPNLFVSFDHYARITNAVGRAQVALIRLVDRSPANQVRLGTAAEDLYRHSGFRVGQMSTIGQLRSTISTVFDVIILFLLAMALLLGIVGGLGLMGTMSINVLERTREIGVMRAIGASDGAILRIVLAEGLIIGLMSWTLGGLIALPASQFLTDAVGQILLQASPSYIFSTGGALLWLVIVLFLAFFASLMPARHASRLTVREVLSYE